MAPRRRGPRAPDTDRIRGGAGWEGRLWRGWRVRGRRPSLTVRPGPPPPTPPPPLAPVAILRERYVAAEARARDGESRLSSAAWDGDVYVGPALNVGTVLAGIALAVPMAGLAFAAATKGVLWGLVDYYGY